MNEKIIMYSFDSLFFIVMPDKPASANPLFILIKDLIIIATGILVSFSQVRSCQRAEIKLKIEIIKFKHNYPNGIH